MSFLPPQGCAADLAEAQDVSVNGVDIFFDFVLLDILAGFAEAAFEEQLETDRFERLAFRKLHRPEVRIGIDERNAANVAARFAANLPDEADFGFFGGIGRPQGQEFVGRKTVSRDNAGTVAAKHDGFRFFRKHFYGGVGAEQNDS